MTHERAIYILKNTAWLGTVNDLADVEKAISILEDAEAPTIEAEPVRRGWWMPFNSGDNRSWFACSRCYMPNAWKANFCPSCGAQMEGQE